ncbi:unnamed protein product [Didymodactylos carnosus]|uniref:Uncharacterized protein n=1 Tax=Didymodactylos carnosus TaxID=1234261 RepID=A0A8S2FPL5_9BILA|nr:unnamed protein product [Didymodactylos carnosus]CAF4317296.1 unnamed protein product [Didymodactylos carnosus]
MATSITFNFLSPQDEEEEILANELLPEVESQPKILKPFPQSILNSIDHHRRTLPHSKSNSDFLTVKQSSLDVDNYHNQNDERRRWKQRSPSEIRVSLFPDNVQLGDGSFSKIETEVLSNKTSSMRVSDPNILEPSLKHHYDNVNKSLLDKKITRRMYSPFGSTSTLKSLVFRRRSSNLPPYRRRPLKTDSKWHIVRHRLTDIAAMSETYIRVKNKNADYNWSWLKQPLLLQMQELREMNQMQEMNNDNKEKLPKSGFKLKNIMENEVIHIDVDGVIHSISTMDLITGRLKQDVHIDKIVHTLVRANLKRVKKRVTSVLFFMMKY